MKPISLFLVLAIVLCVGCHRAGNPTNNPANDCAPVYDATLVAKQIKPTDEPKLYSSFEEPPLYAMPACIDEAYGLTWIPSFHAPVMVRVSETPIIKAVNSTIRNAMETANKAIGKTL